MSCVASIIILCNLSRILNRIALFYYWSMSYEEVMRLPLLPHQPPSCRLQYHVVGKGKKYKHDCYIAVNTGSISPWSHEMISLPWKITDKLHPLPVLHLPRAYIFIKVVLTLLPSVSLHSLGGNGISDEGGRAIAEGLKVNQSLTTLLWV